MLRIAYGTLIMNWDWEKLEERKQRQPGQVKPDLDQLADEFKRFKGTGQPLLRGVVAALVVLWLLSGIYIVEPAEVGVVLRFGAFNRLSEPGPHYHLPFPVETVITPQVTEIRRVEVGFRSSGAEPYQQGQTRGVPEEALMLTGDENIVAVQFVVQYQIKDPVKFLFNIPDQGETVKSAAEAAMREVIGYNKIDSALTTGKLDIQNQTQELLQGILDRYNAGIRVVAVQLQDVHPPKEVSDAFKDVASAREDKIRFINEADAYRNDLIPRTRGLAAQIVNQAQAYKESASRKAQGESQGFLALLKEYDKAKDITRQRLYIEAMEKVFSNPALEKIILADQALKKSVPYLSLDRAPVPGQEPPAPPARVPAASEPEAKPVDQGDVPR